MNFETIEVALFAGNVAAKRFLAIEFAPPNPIVVTGGNGKTVDTVD
jgi:hypothetical protein